MDEVTVNNKIQDLSIGTYNFANATKWIFQIPLGDLFNIKLHGGNALDENGNLLSYPLNCVDVSFPRFQMGSTTLSFLNYSYEKPNNCNITKKDLTCKFLISENWLQYLMLLKWFELEDFTRYNQERKDTTLIELGNGVHATIATTDYEKQTYQNGMNPYYSKSGPIVDCNLYLLDNFNQRMATINFTGCWLKDIRNVDLTYNKTGQTEVGCEFAMSFYKYNIINNDKELKKYIE